VQGVQQTTDVIDVVAYPEGAFDVLRHPGTGPKVGGETCRLGTLQQLFFQSLTLILVELERSSAGRNRLQSGSAAPAQIMLPTAYAAGIDAHRAGHLGLGKTLLKQSDSVLALALQFFRTALRSDKPPPLNNDSIGLYLCRNQ
jgi:hypothetical protein